MMKIFVPMKNVSSMRRIECLKRNGVLNMGKSAEIAKVCGASFVLDEKTMKKSCQIKRKVVRMLRRDRLAHIGAYFGIGVFLGWYLPATAAVLLMILCTIGWEFLQKIINPEVEIDLMDILASLIGGIIGLIFIRII